MIKYHKILFAVFLSLGIFSSNAQILDNSMFRIYRGYTLAQVSQLRLNSNQTFELKIIEISCSICDHEELANSINRIGWWKQRGDTILLEQGNRFLIQNDSILHPLDVIGLNLDSLDQERRASVEQRFLNSNMNDFHLVYDTYPNGIARMIKDRYRYRLGEYELEFNEEGVIKELRYFWNGKRKRKLK